MKGVEADDTRTPHNRRLALDIFHEFNERIGLFLALRIKRFEEVFDRNLTWFGFNFSH
jgi:hypothetical protein